MKEQTDNYKEGQAAHKHHSCRAGALMINITFIVDFFSIRLNSAMIIILLAMIMMNIMINVIMMRMIITSQGLAIMTFLMIIVREVVKKPDFLQSG